MTMTTAPAVVGPARTSASRTGLIWSICRQHRLTLIVVLTGFAACAAWLIAQGLHNRAILSHYLAANCQATGECGNLIAQFQYAGAVIGVLPWLLAIFLGAPLLAREFETGSYRFSSTQGMSLRRQAVARLTVFAVVAIVGTCLAALLLRWSAGPLLRVGYPYDTGLGHWEPSYFTSTVVTLPALALLDLCVGAALGALIRRTVPAMAVTTAAVLALTAFTTGWSVTGRGPDHVGPAIRALLRTDAVARPSGEPPISFGRAASFLPEFRSRGWTAVEAQGLTRLFITPSDNPGPDGSVVVSAWITGPHGRLSSAAAEHLLASIPRSVAASSVRLESWLQARGIGYDVGSQPASRYWLFQAAWAAILLALALLIAAVAIGAIRPERILRWG